MSERGMCEIKKVAFTFKIESVRELVWVNERER